jgi:hypothetical protein
MKTSLLYNGDPTFLFGAGHANEGKFAVQTLRDFISRLADSDVDVYLQCANAQKPWYPSRVLAPVWEGYVRDDYDFVRNIFPPVNATDFSPEMLRRACRTEVAQLNRYLDVLDEGVNWLQEIERACRRSHIAPWLSVRMNDLHGSNNWENAYINCPPQSDPAYRLHGSTPVGVTDPAWQACNYEKPAVRDYYFMMIRELVEDYDYEGLELDWLRCPFCCEAPAAPSALATMNEWFGALRDLTQAKAKRTGRPFALGLRVPVRFDLLKSIGIDVAYLARERLIDFVAPSNYFQSTWDVDYATMRATLTDEVKIFGVIEAAPNWLNVRHPSSEGETFRHLSASAELLRGNAAGKLSGGVDALYLYNFFCADEEHHNSGDPNLHAEYSVLPDIKDLVSLRGQSKHYTLATAYGGWRFSPFEYAEQLPVIIEADAWKSFRLMMCDEAEAAHEVVVQVVLQRTPNAPHLALSFNGSWPSLEMQETNELLFPCGSFSHHSRENVAFNFRFNASEVKAGSNELIVFNGNATALNIRSLEVAAKR